MTSESATSMAIPPPPEHQSLPQNPVNSEPIYAAPPSPPPQVTMEDIVNSNGILTDQAIDVEPSHSNISRYLDSEEYAEKYRRYEDEFKEYLRENYFSGEDMYEEITLHDGESIFTSMGPNLFADLDISFADPLQEGPVEVEDVVVEVVEAEEVEEVGEAEEADGVGEVEDPRVDSASAEIIPNGEISNGGTVL